MDPAVNQSPLSVDSSTTQCHICGRGIGAGPFLNVGPNHAIDKFNDSDDPDLVIWQCTGPCGHVLFSGRLHRDELPPPPIENVEINALIEAYVTVEK